MLSIMIGLIFHQGAFWDDKTAFIISFAQYVLDLLEEDIKVHRYGRKFGSKAIWNNQLFKRCRIIQKGSTS